MDSEVLKMLAHVDQTRSGVRDALEKMPASEITSLIKMCASARIDELDEKERLLVGLLAITSIFDLRLYKLDED